VGLEEGPLSHTEISSSSEYESETETSAGSILLLYTSPPPTPPPPSISPSPIDSPPSYNQNNMSQTSFQEIIRQQQEQMAAMQAQIQALLVAVGGGAVAGGAATGTNAGSHMEVAKLAIFSGEAERVGGFITACRLYIKMKLRGNTVEEQIQWVLTYVQGGSADVWKENIMDELEIGEMEYEMVEDFLTNLRKEFGGGEEESVKAAELRKLEQGGKMMKEFVQEFKRAARGSGYEGRPLVEEFKRGMNRGIRRKLIEAENLLTSIEQWYRRTMALDRNWRESRREEERLRGKKGVEGGAPKQEQRQNLPQLLVWQRRQMPQQATMGPAPIEGVERTNAVVVRGQGQGMGIPPRQDPFAMEVDHGRNCYACGGFGHMVRHCRNREMRGRVAENRRVEYGGGQIEEITNFTNNLKVGEDLELLN